MKTVEFDTKYREKIESGHAEVFIKIKDNEFPVRIICWNMFNKTNGAGEQIPIVALVYNSKIGREELITSTVDGHVYTAERGSEQALYVRYQDLPSKLTRVKHAIANSGCFVDNLMVAYDYDRGDTEAKSWYSQKIDFINKYAKEHMNSLYLRLKESGHWEYDDAEDWEDLNNFKVGDLVDCKRVSAPWMLKVDNTYTITNIKNDVLYVDAGAFGELSFNKYDFVDTFSLKTKEDIGISIPTFDFSTLKTFEKVLVRHPHCHWHPAFFSLYRKECATAPFCVVGENPYGSSYEQCVPFIGNEHLAHTIDPAPAYYGFK